MQWLAPKLGKAGLLPFAIGLGSPPGSTGVYLGGGTSYFVGRSKRVIAVRIGEL